MSFRFTLPGLFVIGMLANFVVSQLGWALADFLQVPIHSGANADYAASEFKVFFAPIDPDIIEDASSTDFQSAAATPSGGSLPTATGTPGIGSPTATQISALPTDILPTAPLIHTAIAPVETAIAPIQTAVGPVTGPVSTLIPGLP